MLKIIVCHERDLQPHKSCLLRVTTSCDMEKKKKAQKRENQIYVINFETQQRFVIMND